MEIEFLGIGQDDDVAAAGSGPGRRGDEDQPCCAVQIAVAPCSAPARDAVWGEQDG